MALLRSPNATVASMLRVSKHEHDRVRLVCGTDKWFGSCQLESEVGAWSTAGVTGHG